MRRGVVRRRTRTAVLALVAAVVLGPLAAVAALLVAVPPPVGDFDPQPWSPPPAAAVTPSTPVDPEPASAPLHGPEDIAVDAAGHRYTGDRHGTIWRISADGRTERFADVGGRPLGLAFTAGPRGDLLVANHGIGLQAVAADGSVRLLADRAGGTPIRFANDLDVTAAGVVHLTDSSARYNTTALGPDAPSYLLPDLVDGRATGRVLRHDLASGRTTVVRDGLHFPNGLVVAADGTRLWVAESTRYRIVEIDLVSGATSVVRDALPGVPDNLNRAADGTVLVGLTDRSAVLDRLVLPNALGRQILARLPAEWLVSRERPPGGSILALDTTGAVVAHHTGIAPAPTSVVPVDGGWVLGGLLEHPLRAVRR